MARAKRTDRTEARRRHRAELAGLAQEQDQEAQRAEAADAAEADRKAGRSGGGASARSGAPRPSLTAALRGSFRPLDLRGDLRAFPRVITHWGVLAAAGATIVVSVVFVLAYGSAVQAVPVGDRKGLDAVIQGDTIPYLIGTMLMSPPPAAGAFLVGYTASRASWLAGLVYGIFATIVFVVVLATPSGRLLSLDNPTDFYALNAFIFGPIGALLFAAASAWYRRFLNLANPNRGRRPTKPVQGRGNVRTNSRAAAGRRP